MLYSLIEKQLILHEGLRLRPYKDTLGKLTIGIGRNLTDRGISEEEAKEMLHRDILGAVADLDRELPWWRSVSGMAPKSFDFFPSVRQRVLIDLCFNMGIGGPHGGLLSFVVTLGHMARGEFEKAADGLASSKWAAQVGPARADRLVAMMRTGIDPKGGE